MSKVLKALDRAGFLAFLTGCALIAAGLLVPFGLWLYERASHGSILSAGFLMFYVSAALAIAHAIVRAIAKRKAR